MEYKIPTPPRGWHFRALLRFRFIIFLIQAVAIYLLFILIDDRLDVYGPALGIVFYNLFAAIIAFLFALIFVRGKRMQNDLRVSGVLVEEACTITTSEEGLQVKGESFAKFYPWCLVKGMRTQGKALVIIRDTNGMALPSLMINAEGVPAEQIKELQTCCNERAGRPTAEDAQLPPAPFAEGVEPMTFSATPEQVEEIALQCSGWRKNRKGRILYFFLLGGMGYAIWALMSDGIPLMALVFFLVLLFYCRKRNRMPELATRPFIAIPRKMQIADGKVCSLNEAGSWAVAPILEPMEAVRYPHTLCVCGKKSGCYFTFGDSDAKLPEGLEPAKAMRPGRPFTLWKAALIVLAGSAVAWVLHFQSQDYALFRMAVDSVAAGESDSLAVQNLAAWNIPGGHWQEYKSAYIYADLQTEPYGYRLTYACGPGADDGVLTGTVLYLPTGHIFYTSHQERDWEDRTGFEEYFQAHRDEYTQTESAPLVIPFHMEDDANDLFMRILESRANKFILVAQAEKEEIVIPLAFLDAEEFIESDWSTDGKQWCVRPPVSFIRYRGGMPFSKTAPLHLMRDGSVGLWGKDTRILEPPHREDGKAASRYDSAALDEYLDKCEQEGETDIPVTIEKGVDLRDLVAFYQIILRHPGLVLYIFAPMEEER